MPGTVSEVSATLVASTMRRAAARLEDALLLLEREPRVERQDLGAFRMVLAQRLGGLADLALARQEDEHVAGGPSRASSSTASSDRFFHVLVFLVFVGGFERAVADLDRIGAAGDFDHGRTVEMLREALGLDRRGGDDDLEIGTPRQQALQVARAGNRC